jgi:hypothetical protein
MIEQKKLINIIDLLAFHINRVKNVVLLYNTKPKQTLKN